VTNTPHASCDAVLLEVMAELDRETDGARAPASTDHIAGCEGCRRAVADMTRMHARLDQLTYDAPAADLWPGIEARIPARVRIPVSSERLALGLAIAALFAWRAAQLLFDLPLPVVNAVIPLAGVALALRWLAGDPFAISASSRNFQQEGV